MITMIVSLCSCATLEETTFEIIDFDTNDLEVQKTVPIVVDTCLVMTLNEKLRPVPQGGDCWGDYLFQFSANNAIVRIYNLAEKRLVQSFLLNKENSGFVKNCHCNSVCFGSFFYEEGDEFPLLYVSTGYSSEGYTGALVYRILKDNHLFSFSLVQTIRLPILDTSWTEFVPAGDICFVSYGNIVYKIPLPSVHCGDIILDGSKDAIEVFDFYPRPKEMGNSRNQGRLYHNGKFILPSGVPQSGEPSLLIFMDLETKTYEHIFSFPDLNLFGEAESIFFWRDKLCVAFLDQIVSFEFTPNILN